MIHLFVSSTTLGPKEVFIVQLSCKSIVKLSGLNSVFLKYNQHVFSLVFTVFQNSAANVGFNVCKQHCIDRFLNSVPICQWLWKAVLRAWAVVDGCSAYSYSFAMLPFRKLGMIAVWVTLHSCALLNKKQQQKRRLICVFRLIWTEKKLPFSLSGMVTLKVFVILGVCFLHCTVIVSSWHLITWCN